MHKLSEDSRDEGNKDREGQMLGAQHYSFDRVHNGKEEWTACLAKLLTQAKSSSDEDDCGG